jgi:hypothetical protein
MPVSIVHPPRDSELAFVARDTLAVTGAPASSFTVTCRFVSAPGRMLALRQNSFTASTAPGAVVGQTPSDGSIAARASLPYQFGEVGAGEVVAGGTIVRGQVKSATAAIGLNRNATGISLVSTVFMSRLLRLAIANYALESPLSTGGGGPQSRTGSSFRVLASAAWIELLPFTTVGLPDADLLHRPGIQTARVDTEPVGM